MLLFSVALFCSDLVNFCEDVLTWMEANPENVVVVHCKGGKGKWGENPANFVQATS